MRVARLSGTYCCVILIRSLYWKTAPWRCHAAPAPLGDGAMSTSRPSCRGLFCREAPRELHAKPLKTPGEGKGPLALARASGRRRRHRRRHPLRAVIATVRCTQSLCPGPRKRSTPPASSSCCDRNRSVQVKPFPWPAQAVDVGGIVAGIFFVYLLVFAFQQPTRAMVAVLVSEKELKLREYMRALGLLHTAYWAGWFATHMSMLSITGVLCALVGSCAPPACVFSPRKDVSTNHQYT